MGPADCEACLDAGGSWQANSCQMHDRCPISGADCCRVLTPADVKKDGLPASYAGVEHAKKCCPSSKPEIALGECETCVSEGKAWQMNWCHTSGLCPVRNEPCCRVFSPIDVAAMGLPADWAGPDR